MATTVDTHVMTAAAENPIPVKQVLAMDDSNGGDGIVAKKEIKTVKDLKGKTVAAQLGAGASYFWLNYVLSQNGLKFSDIKAVDMKAGDAGAAFVAGKVDAAVTWEPWLSRAKETPFGGVLISSDKTPGIIVDSLAFKPAYLKAHGDDVKKIIAAWNEAVKLAADNPTEADAIMAKFTNQKPEEFTKEKTGVRFYGEKENKEYFGTAQKPGSLYKVTQRAADLWYNLKFIKTKPKASDLIAEPDYSAKRNTSSSRHVRRFQESPSGKAYSQHSLRSWHPCVPATPPMNTLDINGREEPGPARKSLAQTWRFLQSKGAYPSGSLSSP
jgi:NitT/TauT family transport system substrate-binding protein